jgi:hypothetical protein
VTAVVDRIIGVRRCCAHLGDDRSETVWRSSRSIVICYMTRWQYNKIEHLLAPSELSELSIHGISAYISVLSCLSLFIII